MFQFGGGFLLAYVRSPIAPPHRTDELTALLRFAAINTLPPQKGESKDPVHGARRGTGMENWNPFGWLLLVGGFLFGVIVGWLQVGDSLWLVSYGVMLAGLTILLTNMIRTLGRYIRSRNLIRARLQI